MDALENFMNNLTDMDSGWFPFVFLKPLPEQRMDTPFVAKISLYFGPFFSIILYLLGMVLRKSAFSLEQALLMIVGFTIAFFVFYRLTFAVMWNRRADRLQRSKAA